MKPSVSILLAVLTASWLASGCNQHRDIPAAILKRRLEPYDFRGRTARAMERHCRRIPRRPEAAWLCARTALDWYLEGAWRSDGALLSGLARYLGMDCSPTGSTECGVGLLEALEHLFDGLERAHPKSLAERAETAKRLVGLLLDEGPSWSASFLTGIRELAQSGPLQIEASVVVAGAVGAVLPRIRRAGLWQRPTLLRRYLGFACPDGQPCPLGCRQLAQELVHAKPSLRKGLIVARCPLDWLGFATRNEARLISEAGFPTIRNLAFVRGRIETLTEADHPLVRSLAVDLEKLARSLDDTVFPLPYPELSPGDPGHRRIAYCSAAEEPATGPVFVSAGLRHLRVGMGPLVRTGPRGLRVVGEQEGLSYPGRIVAADSEQLRRLLAEAATLWNRHSGALTSEPLAFLADARIPAHQLLDIFQLLFDAGVTRIRLLLRNSRAQLGGLTVRLSACPDARPSWHRTTLASVALWADEASLLVTAEQGPLAKEPLSAPVSDISGVRERLEKTRMAYRKRNRIAFFLRGGLPFRDVARLLASAVRNSSGRALYPMAAFQLCHYPNH